MSHQFGFGPEDMRINPAMVHLKIMELKLQQAQLQHLLITQEIQQLIHQQQTMQHLLQELTEHLQNRPDTPLDRAALPGSDGANK